jgi:hypothetical protein
MASYPLEVHPFNFEQKEICYIIFWGHSTGNAALDPLESKSNDYSYTGLLFRKLDSITVRYGFESYNRLSGVTKDHTLISFPLSL